MKRLLLLVWVILSCEVNDPEIQLPIIGLDPIVNSWYVNPLTNFGSTKVSVRANIRSDGGSKVIRRGFGWSNNSTPSMNDQFIDIGKGTGVFEYEISGLEPKSVYYVWAYAINEAGECYSSVQSFGTMPRSLQIGDFWQGGFVFYLDETNWHGLSAMLIDLVDLQWGCKGTLINGANGVVIGTGYLNSMAITNNCGLENSAARMCKDFILCTLYGCAPMPSHLPSKDELNLMYLNLYKSDIAYLMSKTYWSSTQSDQYKAWTQNFSDGTQKIEDKSNAYLVRGVISF